MAFHLRTHAARGGSVASCPHFPLYETCVHADCLCYEFLAASAFRGAIPLVKKHSRFRPHALLLNLLSVRSLTCAESALLWMLLRQPVEMQLSGGTRIAKWGYSVEPLPNALLIHEDFVQPRCHCCEPSAASAGPQSGAGPGLRWQTACGREVGTR